MSNTDRLETLIQIIDLMEDALSAAQTGDERRHIGIAKYQVQCLIKTLRPGKTYRDLAHLFIDAASDAMPPDIFASVMADAKARCNAQKKLQNKMVD